jgi:hypothetical protein
MRYHERHIGLKDIIIYLLLNIIPKVTITSGTPLRIIGIIVSLLVSFLACYGSVVLFDCWLNHFYGSFFIVGFLHQLCAALF